MKAREAARDDEQEQLVSNSEFTAKAIVKLHEHVHVSSLIKLLFNAF